MPQFKPHCLVLVKGTLQLYLCTFLAFCGRCYCNIMFCFRWVDFDQISTKPKVTSQREIVKELNNVYCRSHFGDHMLLYDGREHVYTAGILPFSSEEFEIKLPDGEKKIAVTIENASDAAIHHLGSFLAGIREDYPYRAVDAIDTILRDSAVAK